MSAKGKSTASVRASSKGSKVSVMILAIASVIALLLGGLVGWLIGSSSCPTCPQIPPQPLPLKDAYDAYTKFKTDCDAKDKANIRTRLPDAYKHLENIIIAIRSVLTPHVLTVKTNKSDFDRVAILNKLTGIADLYLKLSKAEKDNNDPIKVSALDDLTAPTIPAEPSKP